MLVPRSWKNADGVAAMRDFLAQRPPRRAAIRDLLRELRSESCFSRRCAADLARRIGAREPGVLRDHVGALIEIIDALPPDEWQPRGHLTIVAAQNARKPSERRRLAAMARAQVRDERIAVCAMAIEAFGILAASEPALHAEAMRMVEHYSRNGTCAMQCRARRSLLLLLAAEQNSQP